MTNKELVIETIKFYSEGDRRAVSDDGTCTYRSSEGRQCAVGRLIDPKKLEKYNLSWNDLSNMGAIDWVLGELSSMSIYIDDILKDEYLGVTEECLDDLQDYHDYTLISTHKEEKTNKLKKKYEIGVE